MIDKEGRGASSVRLIDVGALERLAKMPQEMIFGPGTKLIKLDDVREAPAVDPVEHGHVVWRERQFTGPKYQEGMCLRCGREAAFILKPIEYDEVPYCSKCGARLSDDYQDYCPKCGAKLDGEPEHIKAWRPENKETEQ